MEYGYHLAVDLGAGSGRIMALDLREERPALTEIHRFVNPPVYTLTGTHWNALQMLNDIRAGISMACREKVGPPLSIAVDTWGVDYALLDESGALLGMPYFYRDSRTRGWVNRIRERLPDLQLFQKTGTHPRELNTIYQLLAEQQSRPEIFARAARLVFMPDLINYWLTGRVANENTIASTSGLWNPATRCWNFEVIDTVGLPRHLFHELAEPGTVLGPVVFQGDEHADWQGVPVVHACSHDTASAVAAVTSSPNEAIISLGSWAIVSHAMPHDGISEKAFAAGFAVEGMARGAWRYASNHTGLWLMQRYKADLAKAHIELSYKELERLAGEAKDFEGHIEPNHPRFTNPENMIEEMSAALREGGHEVPQTHGEWTRLICRNLAASFAHSIVQLQDVVGHKMDSIRIIGGGAKDRLLCKMIAEATGLPLAAGPVEATAYGNIMAQCRVVYGNDDRVRQTLVSN